MSATIIFARIARGERIDHFETVRIRRDGSPVEISVSLSPIRGPAGEIIGASGAARLLTDARQTERALQQTLEERRQLFDASRRPDHDHELARPYRADQPEQRDRARLQARRNDRPQRRRFHPSRPSRSIPRGDARAPARRTSEARRHALHSQGRPRGLAVLARQLVGSGQALLLRRARHDRGEARRRILARQRAARAQHRRDRARRLRPDRRSQHHPELELAGRGAVRLAARRGAGQERGRPDRRRERAREGQGRPRPLPRVQQTARPSTAAASSWSDAATARSSRPSSASRR